MLKEPTGEELAKAMFVNMVMMLATSGMQQLGKLVNPETGKGEVNLEAAQASIDMLLMIQTKTKGNLDRDEDRLLRDTLSSLQLNYVETARTQPAAPEAPPGTQPSSPAPATDAATPPPPAKDAKYHKSYG